jgi:hypothetical protein
LIIFQKSLLFFAIRYASHVQHILLLFLNLGDQAGLVPELVRQDIEGILHSSVASAQVLALNLEPSSGLGLHLVTDHFEEVDVGLEQGNVNAILGTGVDERLAHLPLHL